MTQAWDRMTVFQKNRIRAKAREAKSTAPLLIALDRASMRTMDLDGRLHVAATPISKANVCPYRGNEIPHADRLGLAADRTYQMLRHPDELAKAAPTFSRVPLLTHHAMASAANHLPNVVVGATGSDAVFDGLYVRVSLVVWAADAIARVQSGEQRELSAAYRYDADMRPGTYMGVRYDGVMRNIRGSHVALVPEGRAGPDVLVHDAAPYPRGNTEKENTMADAPSDDIQTTLIAYLTPTLTDEQLEDVKQILAGEEVTMPPPAMDAMGRRRLQAQTPAQRAAFEDRFPNANRLR